jgi:hypothetical protein
VKDKSFGDTVKKIDEIIATTFEKLRERWEENRTSIINNSYDNSNLRQKWILPFLKELGFDPIFNASNIKSASGIEYQIPYKAWDSDFAPLIQMVNSSQDLDDKDRNSRTHNNKSPQDCLQQFLNTSDHQWAILTNGKKIRIVRDFYHSITKGFLEFDIEGIFETANSEQFRVLYRVLHKTRFENQYQGAIEQEVDEDGNLIERPDNCLLELFHKKAKETGIKVGNKLREQVINSIELLGNGFAEHLNPDDFQNGQVKAYYAEILNIIYRLLFLMFAEQKGWLPVRNSIYARTYSINSLKERASRGNYSHDEESDIWEGLKITFKLVTKGYKFKNGEKVNAFGGQLFSDRKINTIINLKIKNKFLLDAVYQLSFFNSENLINKINYANLAIDELGSVYESLLDYEPKLAQESTVLGNKQINRGTFYLDDRGSDRKTSGSYYTDSRLVAQLIDSALVPVIDNAINSQNTPQDKEDALLDLKVADIACGSGAFLCAALEKMGEYLAIIRMGDEDRPTDEQLREAKRDVLLHCIYGVDLNPMALELAKFSLWITASLPDMPLSFLDHKLKFGNSLIGATPDIIKQGIPTEAYKEVGGDNKETSKWLRDKVKKELTSLAKGGFQSTLDLRVEVLDSTEEVQAYLELLSNEQETPEEVEAAENEYYTIKKHLQHGIEWRLADAWTASFFIEKTDLKKLYPTNETLYNLRNGLPVNESLLKEIEEISTLHHFFHYHLEFPEVFEKGGFDCLLGNPPWEKIQAEETEFFAPYNDAISTESDSKTRKQLISNLENENNELFSKWLFFKHSMEKTSKFCINSGLYNNSAFGNINLYKVFLDKSINSINESGRIGLIVQSGLFTDELSKDFFEELMSKKRIVSVFDFVNKKKLFGIHPQMRFSLITCMVKNENAPFFRFYLTDPEQLVNKKLGVFLDLEIIKRINPNSVNCPMINHQSTLDILNKIYAVSRIVTSEDLTTPSLQCSLWGEMFNMTRGEKFLWNNLDDIDFETLPLYESKYFHQYDHQYATFKNVADEDKVKGNARLMTNAEKLSQEAIDFRFYVRKNTVLEKCNSDRYNVSSDWFLCLRSITSSTNERTVIASILPKYGVANSVNIVLPKSTEDAVILLGAFNSFVNDFVASTKVGNQNLNIFIIKQLPIPYVNVESVIFKEIKERVIKLSFTSTNLQGFAKDLGYEGDPFKWDLYERFKMQCELDAIYAILYGIEKQELDYVMENFPIVKKRDVHKYGSYRTKETILHMYDEFSWVKEEINNEKNN